MKPTGGNPGSRSDVTCHVGEGKNLSPSERVTSHLTMQDDIRPGPLSQNENDLSLSTEITLTLGGFGQPTIGPCVELHTPDQGARLLTYSNLKRGVTMCFHVTFLSSCLSGMYASVAFSDRLAFQPDDKERGGVNLPAPSPEAVY